MTKKYKSLGSKIYNDIDCRLKARNLQYDKTEFTYKK